MTESVPWLGIDGDAVVWLSLDTNTFTGALFRAPLAGGATERLATIDFGVPKDVVVTDDAYLVYSTPLGEKPSCTTCGLTRVEKSAPHATKAIAAYKDIGEVPLFAVDQQEVVWYFGSAFERPAGVRSVPARGGAVKTLAKLKAKRGSLAAPPQVSKSAIAWVRGAAPSKPDLTEEGTPWTVEWMGRSGGEPKVRVLDWRSKVDVVCSSVGDFVFAMEKPVVAPYVYVSDVFRMKPEGDPTPAGRIDGWVHGLAEADAGHLLAVTQPKGDVVDERIVEVSPGETVVLAEHQNGVAHLVAGPKAAAWVTYGASAATIWVLDR